MLSAYQRGVCLSKVPCLHKTSMESKISGANRSFLTCFSSLHYSLSPTRYDEEQAQSENAERDLRSRSGQSLGSKGSKGSAGVRPAAATWK